MKNIILPFSAIILFLVNPVYATDTHPEEDTTFVFHRNSDATAKYEDSQHIHLDIKRPKKIPGETGVKHKEPQRIHLDNEEGYNESHEESQHIPLDTQVDGANQPAKHELDIQVDGANQPAKHELDIQVDGANQPAEKAKPFAYSAEKGGKTIHLLGTMHAGLSIEEIPCSDEILNTLETSDLFLSEIKEPALALIRHLGDNWQAALYSKKERREILKSLPENERAIVSKELTYYDNLMATALSDLLEGTQLVDKQKESFEDLSPPARELLTSRGMSAQGSYVDYLHSIFLEILSLNATSVHKLSLDVELFKTALSANIPAESMDLDESTLAAEIIKIIKEINTLEIYLPNAYTAGREIDSSDINRLVTMLFKMKNTLKEGMRIIKQTYLSDNNEFFLQVIDRAGSEAAGEFLLKNRNQFWFQKIIAAFESHKYENIFVSGGLAHFIGPFNVLDMLAEDGFIIKRLSCEKTAGRKMH